MTDIDPTNPVAAMTATLAEFDNPSPNGTTASPVDDLMASFSLAPDGSLKVAGAPDPTPPAPVEPPAPAAQDAPPPVPDEFDLPATAPTATRNSWDKLKSKKRELEDQVARQTETLKEREARLAEYEAKVARMAELEERAKLADEAERELAISRVEGTREYKETILAPLEAIGANAETLAAANEIPIDNVLAMLTERDPAKQREKLKEIISGMDTVDQHAMIAMAEDSRKLLARQEEIRSRATEARKELEEIGARKAAEAEKASRSAFEKAVTHTVEELKKRVPFSPLAEGETADAVFGLIAEKVLKANARPDDPGVAAYAATAGVLLPRVTQQLKAAMEKIRTLEERVAQTNASKPSVGGQQPPPSQPMASDEDFLGPFSKVLGIQRPRNILEALAE